MDRLHSSPCGIAALVLVAVGRQTAELPQHTSMHFQEVVWYAATLRKGARVIEYVILLLSFVPVVVGIWAIVMAVQSLSIAASLNDIAVTLKQRA